MPESPEVQELASFLTAHTTGREVRAVDVLLPKALKTQHPAPPDLVGRRIDRVSRSGKMIDIATPVSFAWKFLPLRSGIPMTPK